MWNELKSGDVLVNRYEIDRPIGRGGMGLVYLARDWKLGGKAIAVKMLSFRYAGDESTYQRFLDEFALTRSLQHPNIIEVFDLEKEGNSTFLTMEYVDGKTLTALMKDHHMPFSVLTWILAEIAEGLEFAHTRGIVHRDLKPENVLVTEKGQLRLLDFGLARLEGGERLTAVGETVGTPEYMSPEQAEGKLVDLRSDIYSLGILAFELAAGAPPFQGPDFLTIARQQLTKATPSLKEQNPETPDWYEKFVCICTEKKPENRFQSCSAAIEFLKRKEGTIGGSKYNKILGQRFTEVRNVAEDLKARRMGTSEKEEDKRQNEQSNADSKKSSEKPASRKKRSRESKLLKAQPLPREFKEYEPPEEIVIEQKTFNRNYALLLSIGIMSLILLVLVLGKDRQPQHVNNLLPPPITEQTSVSDAPAEDPYATLVVFHVENGTLVPVIDEMDSFDLPDKRWRAEIRALDLQDPKNSEDQLAMRLALVVEHNGAPVYVAKAPELGLRVKDIEQSVLVSGSLAPLEQHIGAAGSYDFILKIDDFVIVRRIIDISKAAVEVK